MPLVPKMAIFISSFRTGNSPLKISLASHRVLCSVQIDFSEINHASASWIDREPFVSIPMNQTSAVVSARSVGVVIPTYNRDDLLEICLEHVAHQTLQPARIIIIDNGARNVMPEFLRKFE